MITRRFFIMTDDLQLPKKSFAGSPAPWPVAPGQTAGLGIPSPALEAEYRAARPPTSRPTSKVPFTRRQVGDKTALALSPLRHGFDDFLLSRQAMRCTPATPGDWAKDSGEHRTLASPAEAREAHHGSGPRCIAPRLLA